MNEASVTRLSPMSFLLVWIFSVIPTTLIGGRWKVAALSFIGLTGGYVIFQSVYSLKVSSMIIIRISMSLAICIIIHPSLSSRIILASIFTPLLTLTLLLPSVFPFQPFTDILHATSRVASSCTGAFSAVQAIALLTHKAKYYSWANAWDRLWVSNDASWQTEAERGFDALFCVFWISGMLVDWALRKWIGEDPDEVRVCVKMNEKMVD